MKQFRSINLFVMACLVLATAGIAPATVTAQGPQQQTIGEYVPG